MRYTQYILQCALAVFEGLLPPRHDKIVRKLLFELNTWHSFAKFRIQLDATLDDLSTSHTRLGKYLRLFNSVVCPACHPRELPSEVIARNRRRAAKASHPNLASPEEVSSLSAKRKEFNMNVYKFHALGDYPEAIRRHGTTDSYSTQIVCNCPQILLVFSNLFSPG